MRGLVYGAALAGLLVAGCGNKADSGAGDGAGSKGATGDTPAAAGPGGKVTGLAKGTWQGPWGKLVAKDDGTADLEIRNCGYENLEPGFVKLGDPAKCNPSTTAGQLVLKDYEIGIKGADGSTLLYAAYLDGQGKLHLGVGGADTAVAPFSTERKGTAQVSMFQTLEVGDTCTLADKMKDAKVPVPCAWVEKDGRTVLTFDTPDKFEPGKVEKRGFVHLKDLGLLVAPAMLDLVYTKS